MGTNHYDIRTHLFFNVTTTLLGSAFCGMEEYHNDWGGGRSSGWGGWTRYRPRGGFWWGVKEPVSPAKGGPLPANGYSDGSVNAVRQRLILMESKSMEGLT